MIAVIQRCSSSSVRIDNKKISEIAYGLTVLLGICINDKEKDGKVINAVHYNRPEGYIILGQRFARQGYALIKGEKPAEDGRP